MDEKVSSVEDELAVYGQCPVAPLTTADLVMVRSTLSQGADYLAAFTQQMAEFMPLQGDDPAQLPIAIASRSPEAQAQHAEMIADMLSMIDYQRHTKSARLYFRSGDELSILQDEKAPGDPIFPRASFGRSDNDTFEVMVFGSGLSEGPLCLDKSELDLLIGGLFQRSVDADHTFDLDPDTRSAG